VVHKEEAMGRQLTPAEKVHMAWRLGESGQPVPPALKYVALKQGETLAAKVRRPDGTTETLVWDLDAGKWVRERDVS
jgi:hypothetical protein